MSDVSAFTLFRGDLVVVSGGDVLGASLIAFAVIVIALVWRAVRPRRQVSWQVLLDSPVSQGTAGSLDAGTWSLLLSGREVYHAGLVLLEVRNTGGRPVSDEDWAVPLSFSFPGRQWVAAELIESRTSRGFIPDALDDRPGSAEIVLPPLTLNPGDGFKLLAVLSGDLGVQVPPWPGVRARGSLMDGRIVQTYGRYTRYSRYTRVAFALACVLLGVIGGLLLAPGGTRHEYSFQLSGSWLWPAFVALLSLALAAAGFALGRWVPPAPAASPVTPGQALRKGYLDALMLPSPPARQARPPIARELVDDVRDLVTRLESPPGVRGDR
jgi:hypothetical protein